MPIAIHNAIASLAVRDLSKALAWYQALFGRAADSTPMPEVAEWKFPRGGWLQVYKGADRAGRGSVTLAVDDIDGIAAHVAKLGIDTPRRTSTPKVKTLMISDHDGNSIAFAQTLDETMAR